VIELFGDRTGNCLRVTVTFEEAGLPYKTRRVSLGRGQHMQAAFLELNPTGKVPTMVDTTDGRSLVLSQSLAIMLWASDKGRIRLMPPERTPEHALAMERLFMVATDMVAFSQAAFMLHLSGQPAGSAVLNGMVLARLDWLEQTLGHSPYIAGNAFTLADISAATLISSIRGNDHWVTRPRLSEWFARISAREGFVRGMHAFDEGIAA
jgi:GSH-dependent disulfide-bond oxidoreductase